MTQPAPQPNPGATPTPAAQPTQPAPTSTSIPAQPAPAPTGQPAPAPADDDKPLGPAGERALAAEREARKDLERKLAALDPLRKLAEALGGQPGTEGKTEVQLLQERFAAQEKALADERVARWRAEVMSEKKLTADQAAFLAGATREELAASADKLLAAFPAGATPAPGTSPGATPEPAKPGAKTPAPDPSQGSRGGTPAARPTSLGAAISAAMKPGG